MKYMLSLMFTICLLIGGQAHAAGVVQLPATGQTVSYVAGDDGALQKGALWPNPRFVDNSVADPQNLTVTDTLTNLIWSKDGNAPGPAACGPATAKTWQGALDYAQCLNNNSYLGKTDWRLPNSTELISLVNYGQTSPATWLNTKGFSTVQGGIYWSSSTYPGSTGSAWIVGMNDGHTDYGYKTYSYYVWPVRGGQLFLPLSVSKTGSGTVTSSSGGINCGSTCSASFATGATVSLTATPAMGSSFSGWSSPCSGSGACTVTMNAAQSVTATFSLIPINGAGGISNSGTFTETPTTNLCTTGTASTITGSGAWSWTCNGSNGGSNVTCSAAIQTYAVTATVTGVSVAAPRSIMALRQAARLPRPAAISLPISPTTPLTKKLQWQVTATASPMSLLLTPLTLPSA